MGRLNAVQELYKGSISDISFNIECQLFFKGWKKRHKYTRFEFMFKETLRLLKKELKILLAEHKREWDEEVDVKVIENTIKGAIMKTEVAVNMIKQIVAAGIALSDKESDFLESIICTRSVSLSQKQVNWLTKIYERIIL